MEDRNSLCLGRPGYMQLSQSSLGERVPAFQDALTKKALHLVSSVSGAFPTNPISKQLMMNLGKFHLSMTKWQEKEDLWPRTGEPKDIL